MHSTNAANYQRKIFSIREPARRSAVPNSFNCTSLYPVPISAVINERVCSSFDKTDNWAKDTMKLFTIHCKGKKQLESIYQRYLLHFSEIAFLTASAKLSNWCSLRKTHLLRLMCVWLSCVNGWISGLDFVTLSTMRSKGSPIGAAVPNLFRVILVRYNSVGLTHILHRRA